MEMVNESQPITKNRLYTLLHVHIHTFLFEIKSSSKLILNICLPKTCLLLRMKYKN